MSEVIAPEQSMDIVLTEGAEMGQDTQSSHLAQSLRESEHHLTTDGEDDDSQDLNNPISSRGSTRETGEDDYMSMATRNFSRAWAGRDVNDYEEEDEKEADGSPILTNKFLRELFKKEFKKYYWTPYLNEKLFLHYKGFHFLKNMGQFTELKCLYFEGNGCESLLGLEHNTQLKSLFIQENVLTKIEGLDNLKELRQLNVSDNLLKKIEGLGGCSQLDTLYIKRNRLGQLPEGDIETMKGLLECPTITCLDISDNYLSDPALLEEIFMKMPQLRVLYSNGNKFCN